MEKDQSKLYISMVIPVKDEEGNLSILHEKISKALSRVLRPYEIIYIDDGSVDDSFKILAKIREQDPHVGIIKFRRNFGQSAALQAGFNESKGNIVITIDSDLQNDPNDIPKILSLLENSNCDVVSGVRVNRKDNLWSKVIPSKIANWLISKSTGVYVHDLGCSLKAYRKDILDNIFIYGELHRFLPILCALSGAKVQEISVEHVPRHFGKSKYGINRVFKVLVDLLNILYIKSFSTKPLHFFGIGGLVFFIAGFLIDFIMVLYKLIYGTDIGGRPLLLFGTLLILSGLQIFFLGLIAELFLRNSLLLNGKKPYVVSLVLKSFLS